MLWIGGITVTVVVVVVALVFATMRLASKSEPMSLEGRVTDSEGRPLADALVVAMQGHERIAPDNFLRDTHAASARTDADGRYVLEGLRPVGLIPAMGLEGGGHGGAYSWYTVDITLPGYASAKAYVPVVPGWVRTAARLFRRALEATFYIYVSVSEHEKADLRNHEPFAHPPCRGRAMSGVDAMLYRSARVEGVVVDGLGLPCPACAVCLEPSNERSKYSYQPRAELSKSVMTDAEGRFRLDGVPPGEHRVRVSERGRIVRKPPFPLLAVREGEHVADVRFEHDALPFGSVQGTVVDAANGRPVSDFNFYVSGVTPAVDYTSGNGSWRRLCLCGNPYTHTKECGRWLARAAETNDLRTAGFLLQDISAGSVRMNVKAPGYAEEAVAADVMAGQVTELTVGLWRSGSVRIRPVVEAGAKVDYYASVAGNPPLVHYSAIPEEGGIVIRGGRPSKESGVDAFDGLRPGRYTIRGAVGYLFGEVTRYEAVAVDVHSGQASETALDFTGSCGVTVKLAFAPGTTVWVLLETADSPSGQDMERSTGVRARAFARKPGRTRIPDLKPGVYRMSLFRRTDPKDERPFNSGAPDRVETITLEEGRTVSRSFSF